MDEFFLVVDFGIKLVEVLDDVTALEGQVWLLEVGILRLDFLVQTIPLFVEVFSVFLVHLNSVDFLLRRIHFQRFIKGKRINFFKDGLKRDKGFLQNLVPMIFSQVDNDGDQHWECLLFIGFEDVQKVVVFEETHSSISDLKMNATDTFNNSFKKSRNKVFNSINLAHFKDLLKLGEEQSFLDAVSKRPILKKSFQKRNG